MTPPASAVASNIPARSRRVSSGPRTTRMTSAGAVAAPGITRPRTRTRPHTAPERRRKVSQPTLVGRLIGLSNHRLLDRLIRGRVWIGIVAFALIGIVAMQLAILKLNTGIGHSLQRVAQLQRENPALSIENSAAAAGENVEPQATARGMEMTSVATIQFLKASNTDIRQAAQILSKDSTATSPTVAQSSTQTSAGSSEAASVQTPTASSPEAQQSQVATESPVAAPASEPSSEGDSTAPSTSEVQQQSYPQSTPSTSDTESSEPSSQTQSVTAAGGGTQAAPQG